MLLHLNLGSLQRINPDTYQGTTNVDPEMLQQLQLHILNKTKLISKDQLVLYT